MLTNETRAHLAEYTCTRCGEPLGRFHVYPVLDLAQVIRQTSETAPMHLECAEEHAEAATPQVPLYALYVVKAAPRSASARVIRLLDHDPASAVLHLYSPDSIKFKVQTFDGPHVITRPAEYDEIKDAMIAAIADMMQSSPSKTEQQEIAAQIALLHKHLPQIPTSAENQAPSTNNTEPQ